MVDLPDCTNQIPKSFDSRDRRLRPQRANTGESNLTCDQAFHCEASVRSAAATPANSLHPPTARNHPSDCQQQFGFYNTKQRQELYLNCSHADLWTNLVWKETEGSWELTNSYKIRIQGWNKLPTTMTERFSVASFKDLYQQLCCSVCKSDLEETEK